MTEFDGANPNLSPQRNTKLAVFFMPTIFLYLMFTTLTILPWYTGMILAMAEFFGMHHVSIWLPQMLDDAQTFLLDCHARFIKQTNIHRECHFQSLLLWHHFWLDGLGCVCLGNTAIAT